MYGRKISLIDPVLKSAKHAMNCAVNYPIQGAAAEIFKRILLEAARFVPIESFILQVHDEQLFDGVQTLPQGLDRIAGFWTPLETSVIERWQ